MSTGETVQPASPPFELPGMDEAWQAHLFALTVHLNERGVFTWATWVTYFSKALRDSGQAGPALANAGGEGLSESLKDMAGRARGETSGPANTPVNPAQEASVNRAYFLAWQDALEQLLSDLEIALPLDIGLRAQASACYPRLARAPLVFRALAQAPGKDGPA